MDKQEFKQAMMTLDSSIDAMFNGDYEKVAGIVDVTEKLIVDSKYPRKWFNYYSSYTFEKTYKKLYKKYGYRVQYLGSLEVKLMQARKHELQGYNDHMQYREQANFILRENARYMTLEEKRAIELICLNLGELAYKYKKVITLA